MRRLGNIFAIAGITLAAVGAAALLGAMIAVEKVVDRFDLRFG